MKIKEALLEAKTYLEAVSETSRLDAELLLAHSLKLKRLDLVIKSEEVLADSDLEIFKALIDRRKNHEPLAYITGLKEFWGLDFKVNKNVLIPRPDSEILVEKVLERTKSIKADCINLADFGTGSGCLAISVAHELKRQKKNFIIWAFDKSISALEVARENARLNNCEEIIFEELDWHQELTLGSRERANLKLDIAFSNPPYLTPSDTLAKETALYEPKQALFAEELGLKDIKVLLSVLQSIVSDSFFFEIGFNQKEVVQSLLEASVWNYVNCHQDLAGLDRVIELHKVK